MWGGMDWREWCEVLGIQKKPSVTAAFFPHGKEERVKMRLPLVSTVQQIQDAINGNGSGNGNGNGNELVGGNGGEELGLFLPTRNHEGLCLKQNLPLWRYHFDSNAFSNLSVKKISDQSDPDRIGLIVLNRKEEQKGASLFSFSPESLSLDVIDSINDTFSLNLDLKFYGLFVYEKKNRGKFVGLKKTLNENGIGEMMIVEVRHLSIFEFVEKTPSTKGTKPLRFTFRDHTSTEEVLKEMSQGISSPSSPLALLHLPYGEKSSIKNWLPLNTSLKSCRIGIGSLLVICEVITEGNTRKRGTIHRALYVNHSPIPAHHNWRATPNHPNHLVGEEVKGTIPSVILLKPGGEKVKGDLHLTNANVVFAGFSQSFSSYSSYTVTPLLSIARIDLSPSGHGVDLHCKNVRTVRFLVDAKSPHRNHLVQMLDKLVFPTRTREIFAFAMKAAFQERDDGWDLFQGFHQEMARQAVPESRWRVSFINAGYQLCDTYPSQVIVPSSFGDNDLIDVFSYRSKGRIPVLTYYHPNGAAITRSSQPMSGLSGRTCANDERLLECIRTATKTKPQPTPLYIFDARPRINAMGNQAAGAGYEITGSGTGYPECKLEFLNIDNIHVIRKCHTTLQFIMEERIDDPNWYSLVESSGWLVQVRLILLGAARVVEVIENEGASVLVHCSDGWDRTAQVCALSQIMLCPHFRTIEGFQVLIEKDWLAFGHKFAQRHGHTDRNADDQQRAPIFLQFIDAVWQMTEQFPCSFEFNSQYLLDIVDASYACHTGTFLGNCELERKEAELRRKTVSLWTLLKQSRDSYKNVFFVPDSSTMVPDLSPDHLSVWKDYFLRSRWEGREGGGVGWGGGSGGGMTPTLRFMQMEGALEGRKKAWERVAEENKDLRRRVEGLRGVVKERLGEEVLEGVDGEGKEGEKEGGEKEGGKEAKEGREDVGEEEGNLRGTIEQLHARILFLEKELKEERESTRYLVLEDPASSFGHASMSPSFSPPPISPHASSPLSSPSASSSPSSPPTFFSSPLPNRNAPLPPSETSSSSVTSQKSLSSLLSTFSNLPTKTASVDFSDWAILGTSEEKEKEKEREKEKKEKEKEKGKEGGGGDEEGRVFVFQKRRLGEERTTPSPSSDPIL